MPTTSTIARTTSRATRQGDGVPDPAPLEDGPPGARRRARGTGRRSPARRWRRSRAARGPRAGRGRSRRRRGAQAGRAGQRARRGSAAAVAQRGSGVGSARRGSRALAAGPARDRRLRHRDRLEIQRRPPERFLGSWCRHVRGSRRHGAGVRGLAGHEQAARSGPARPARPPRGCCPRAAARRGSAPARGRTARRRVGRQALLELGQPQLLVLRVELHGAPAGLRLLGDEAGLVGEAPLARAGRPRTARRAGRRPGGGPRATR